MHRERIKAQSRRVSFLFTSNALDKSITMSIEHTECHTSFKLEKDNNQLKAKKEIDVLEGVEDLDEFRVLLVLKYFWC